MPLDDAIARLLVATGQLPEGERVRILQAVHVASKAHKGQTRADGSPYVVHAVAAGELLASWGADADTVIAGILHDTLEDTELTPRDIHAAFGHAVLLLVEGVTKFTQADLGGQASLDRKVETLRKLFEVMRDDIRVALIKLADRLHNIRTIETLPLEQRTQFAHETIAIYSKLAFHLGMNAVRREFSEICMPLAYSEESQRLAEFREHGLAKARLALPVVEERLRADAPKGAVTAVRLDSRSLESLFILEQKNELLEQDSSSIVVIARDVEACFAVFKTLHSLFRPVSAKFRDYIAAPTESGYQSLHTAVVGPEGTLLNIRIRTPEMDDADRLGIALHCFAPGKMPLPGFSWLRRSASLDRSTRESSNDFWAALQNDIFPEPVQVTVDGQVVAVPPNATVLDAAYARHGRDGHRVTGIEANGIASNRAEAVREDMVIRVTLGAQPHVSFDWLQSTTTNYARSLIVEKLKERTREEKLAIGGRLLQKELDTFHLGLLSALPQTQQQNALRQFRRDRFEDVVAMVGEGVLSPGEVLQHLLPSGARRSFFGSHDPLSSSFRLLVRGTQQQPQTAVAKLYNAATINGVTIQSTNLREEGRAKTTQITVRGRYRNPVDFGDFLATLEGQDWVSEAYTLISHTQWLRLILSFTLAFVLIMIDILILPYLPVLTQRLPFLSMSMAQTIPFLPIFFANYQLLRLLRRYIVRMRQERWWLGVGFLMNIVGLLLVVARMVQVDTIRESLVPLIAIFIVSLAGLTYIFFQTESIFTDIERGRALPMSITQWKALRHRKIMGYGIRLIAVILWGLEPIYIRYSSVNTLSPFLRTFLLGVGVLAVSGTLHAARSLQTRRSPFANLRLPYERFFVFLIIGQIGYMYLKNASLVYTSGTNLLLFNNFAPLLGLLIATVFWRRDIPYLRQPRTMLWIFLLALVAGTGSSLLLYEKASVGPASVFGDILAFIATGFDVLLVVGQIQYIKRFPRTNPALLNLHVFFFLLLCTAPVLLISPFMGWQFLKNLTSMTLLLGLGIGLFEGIGQMCNYEAFKRIDGYLAHMMFNLSILITFMLEVFLLHAVELTPFLIVSAVLIIGASVTAELINSRCEREGA